ncbi:retrovirus-related Pol polyprotein from transposon 17.6 [Trichonephila inaurata madagascariensis]|uniref:Retrovirus-related Pol polyprotein from transposon 17.6 n=1 Tax=Trichonephila inaurata madagascariensis TaxID=2747483 RepID=A0A8X7BUP6_9ARAC|nr:retrovirus-related Pol polyprotein from transposon 17.6 [Trichonephila inaurata madagascariensis]
MCIVSSENSCRRCNNLHVDDLIIPAKDEKEGLETKEVLEQGKTTELHTDVSQQGYGAVLLQEAEDGKLHPDQYISQKTTPAEEKYNSYELEVLAIVNALKKFRTSFLGNHFKIITDCSAFQKTGQKRFSYSYSKMGITVRRV